jgi:hypothetical protein
MTAWDNEARAARQGKNIKDNPWNDPADSRTRQMLVECKASEWEEGFKIEAEKFQFSVPQDSMSDV